MNTFTLTKLATSVFSICLIYVFCHHLFGMCSSKSSLSLYARVSSPWWFSLPPVAAPAVGSYRESNQPSLTGGGRSPNQRRQPSPHYTQPTDAKTWPKLMSLWGSFCVSISLDQWIKKNFKEWKEWIERPWASDVAPWSANMTYMLANLSWASNW